MDHELGSKWDMPVADPFTVPCKWARQNTERNKGTALGEKPRAATGRRPYRAKLIPIAGV